MSERWRVGTRIPVNVYEGDRPICQTHTAMDAKRIVAAINGNAPAPRTFTAEEVTPLVEALREAGIILAKLREDYLYDCPVDTSTAADKLAAALAIWYAKLSAPAKEGR